MLYKIFIAATICLVLVGCIDLDLDLDFDLSDIADIIVAEMGFVSGISVHRLYEEDDLIFDEKLLGTWVDESGTTFAFDKAEEPNAYVFTVSDANTQGKFVAYLVKIDEMLFLDISPENPAEDSISFQQLLNVPCHMFMKVEQIEPGLRMRWVYFVSLIEDNPNILKHEVVGESNILVTASTRELQEFLKQHRHNEELFETEPEVLIRYEGCDSSHQ